jgi:hypothetical protein
MTNYTLKCNIKWKFIILEILEQNEVVKRLEQILMNMINAMLKNADLSNKWWIELIKTINYLRNRSSIVNRDVIFYETINDVKLILSNLQQIETINYVITRKLATRWKKFQNRAFQTVFVDYEKDHIYRMLISNETIIAFSQSFEKTRNVSKKSSRKFFRSSKNKLSNRFNKNQTRLLSRETFQLSSKSSSSSWSFNAFAFRLERYAFWHHSIIISSYKHAFCLLIYSTWWFLIAWEALKSRNTSRSASRKITTKSFRISMSRSEKKQW